MLDNYSTVPSRECWEHYRMSLKVIPFLGEDAGVFIHQLPAHYCLGAPSGGVHSGTSSLHCKSQNMLPMLED